MIASSSHSLLGSSATTMSDTVQSMHAPLRSADFYRLPQSPLARQRSSSGASNGKTTSRSAATGATRLPNSHPSESVSSATATTNGAWTPPLEPSQMTEWHPGYQCCVSHFINHAQHSREVQALAGYINIRLPFQHPTHPISSLTLDPATATATSATRNGVAAGSPSSHNRAAANASPSSSTNSTTKTTYVPLTPYVRRLVATGYDNTRVLSEFFGTSWRAGIGPIHESERRNYLFACKSEPWLAVKAHYDMEDGQHVPFLRPMRGVAERDIVAAERDWSDWLAMQDWMIGPRAPGAEGALGRGLDGLMLDADGTPDWRMPQ